MEIGRRKANENRLRKREKVGEHLSKPEPTEAGRGIKSHQRTPDQMKSDHNPFIVAQKSVSNCQDVIYKQIHFFISILFKIPIGSLQYIILVLLILCRLRDGK